MADRMVLAGELESGFDLVLVDNTQADGPRQVTVRVQAPGFGAGSAVLTIFDDEPPPAASQPQPVDRAPDDDSFGSTGYQMVSASGLLAQTSNNRVFLSTDAGGSWAAVPLPAEFNGAVALQRAQQLGDARLLLSTFSGRSWYTRNRGTTWAELRAGGGLELPAMSSVSFFDRREGLVMARDGSSARTTDGGQTWATSTPNDPNGANGYGWRQARFLPGTDVGWVMSDSSTILRSTDRGRTWSAPLPQTSAVMVGLSDFHFIDAQRGWAVSNLSYGDQDTIFRSTNGGLSWQAIAGTGGYGNLSAVRFAADGQNGVALGGNGFALVTSDGGGTWAPRSLGISVTLRRAVFMNDGTTVVLSAASSYNGPTTVQNSGVLKLGANNVLPTSPQTALTLNTKCFEAGIDG